ncbi:nitronate monooxygenase family protein [Ammoniphilus sp. YIM 78166]|uniref:NAD(P)H-dependent flavin oxidoreductase n=1 Tax=Ammoniphilus sp. YIM 78166 TaxID=1644106 RepID=UPI00106FA59F|nr:nitronate monooxygenase [Ammoniphilus sp. YIM 78166]
MGWNQTIVASQLNITYPIIQAGMAGGATTPELVAAVSNAGGLGTLGAGYMSPEQIRLAIQKVKALTTRPFAVNLFIPEAFGSPHAEEVNAMNSILRMYRDRLGLMGEPDLTRVTESFDEQLKILLEEAVPVFSFTFGIPSDEWIAKLKEKKIITIGTATNVREGLELEKKGIDMIVGQGYEAGGHRGTFITDPKHSLIGTMSLIPQLADHVSIPVIAAGGIMDGRGIAASLMLGAKGVQLGTAFLTCHESGAHQDYQRMILEGTEEQTTLTTAFSGKLARGIKNLFMNEMESHQQEILPYPIQNTITRDIRLAAAQQNQPEYLSMWAGQGIRLSKKLPANELIEQWVRQTSEIM